MNTTRGFNRKLLANAIASVVLVGMGGTAYAQEAEQSVEEVLVLGVRGAQQSAINTKRDAGSIVDGISAEDIGKLPDVTITDSLQRITGVQIQRSAGEGGRLSVRGMEQVAVMLNGEQFLAAGNLASAQPDFNDVPAQLLRAATVYKTLDVTNAQSGITGTIDIETFRPFDFKDGFSAAGGIDLSTGEISGQTDPTFNGVLAWHNDSIGVMLSGVTGQKNLANDYVGRASGDPDARELGAASEFNGDWVVTHGHGFEFFSAENERNRSGLSAALQADLGNGLEVVIEGFYTDAKEYQRRAGLNLSNRWQGQGSVSAERDAYWNPRYSDPGGWTGAQIAIPTSASQTATGADGRDWIVADQYSVEPLWVYSLTQNRVVTTASNNYNVELNWDNGEALTGGFRFIYANAENNVLNATAQGGINSFRGDTVQQLNGHFYPADVVERYGLTLDPDRLDEVGVRGGRYVLPNPLGYDADPLLDLDYSGFTTHWSGFDRTVPGGLSSGGNDASLADYMANKDSWIMEGEQLEVNNDTVSNLTAASLNGNYKFEDSIITDIDFGIRKGKRMVDVENYDYWAQRYVGSDMRLTGPGAEGANNVVGCYAMWRSIDQQFDGGGSRGECAAGERLDASDPDSFAPYFVLPPQPLDWNGEDLLFVDDLGDYATGIPGFWAVDPKTFDDPEAFNREAFGDIQRIINPGSSFTINLNELSGFISGNFEAGIVKGNAGVRFIDTEIIASIYQTTPTQRAYGGSVYYTGRETQSKSRTYVLPSLNMSIQPTDELVFRVAAAKNKQELNLDRYGSSLTIFTGPDPDDATQRIPSGWNSNGNINLEPWMTTNFDVSAEYYYGDASMFSVGAYMVNIETFVENTTSDITVEQNGRTFTISGTGPTEGKGGDVKGLELSGKVAFSDFISGDSLLTSFGAEANYTYSPSERPGNASDISGNTYPFANNSEHTYNLILWYQNAGWQASVRYNGRSERFDRDFGGEYGFATYTPEASYLDMNVSYDIMDEVTVYFQGSNLTSTDYKQVYRLKDGVEQAAFVYDNEARFSLGVRAKF